MSENDPHGPLLDALALALLQARVPNASWEKAPDYFRDHLRGQARPVLRALGALLGDEPSAIVRRIRARRRDADGRAIFDLSDEQAAALIVALVARQAG